ncbi:MAG TPA: flagellar motor protein MotB, partial [Cyanobacteria bacterium UBA8543]|nr:flagellar motor protein MotB [Cyanobacteria bacterium UBA8543]
SHQPKEQPEESENPTVLSKVELNQPKNVDTQPEQQVFNQLIQSHWQKAQRQDYIRQSVGATDELDNSITLFERWQRLLLTQEVMDSRQTIANFKTKLESLEHQIYEPTELTNLLLPLITELLTLKVGQARQEVAQAIGPVVDEMIQHRAQQDMVALGSALAPVLSEAVVQQVTNSPGDLAKALGPEMGTAIKEQIVLERDAMVDALYPVIGSTVSKYFAEVIRAINRKVESTLSLEGISRKIRAKMQGVSEAELILTEAMPFTVQAIFLIHKASGLVISEVQPLDTQRLESEMVAGMLTAIRSFVNDCIAQSGDVSEIDQIEYGNSKIILEVAGYCYLAVVIQGEHPPSFIQRMRKTLVAIVQRHGKAVELFDGDPSNVPEQIYQLLEGLTKFRDTSLATKGPITPVGLMLVSLAVIGAISIPIGIYKHGNAVDRKLEEKTNLALASDPELAVYRLTVDAHQGTLKLSGRLPNQYLKAKAEQVARKVEPKVKIQNTIIPVVVPADPVTAQAEVKRVTDILNQMEGAVISADYSQGKVTVQGTVLQETDAKKVTQAFEQIPGVESVTNTVQLQPMAIASRIYFDRGSSELKSEELAKVSQIREFLKQYPNKQLQLLGHTDPQGTVIENEPLALERATKVRDALVNQGVDPKRLQVAGTTKPPIGVKAEQLPLLSRCVEFRIISP